MKIPWIFGVQILSFSQFGMEFVGGDFSGARNMFFKTAFANILSFVMPCS